MARLIVEACTSEWTAGDVVYTLLIGVSVSRVEDGTPVTGLKPENFRVASSIGIVKDFKVVSAYEREWEPGDVEPSGCYELHIIMTPVEKFFEGSRYVFGIQARTFAGELRSEVIDQGQTIVELISLGE